VDEEDGTREISRVRQGLALICFGAIGLAVGFAGRHQDDPNSVFDSPSIGEQIAQVVGGIGGLTALCGLALVAFGLLRD
jgi:hypothetical protein